MKSRVLITLLTTLIMSTGINLVPSPADGGEITAPYLLPDRMTPETAARIKYVENGDYTTVLKIPTYEWMPVGRPPNAIILGIHGLTLHGRRYRILARTSCLHGFGFVALDMRGFGLCHDDPTNRFSEPGDDKHKINYEKSYHDIEKLVDLIRQKYPGVPILALGESLGCTFCVRLAGEHPDKIAGIVLSAPAIKINPKMYLTPSDIEQGVLAIIHVHHGVELHEFFKKLVSERPEVVREMIDDPLILKQVGLLDMLATDEFCEKTVKWGKMVSPTLPVLIIQGGGDNCVVSKDVVDLMYAMPTTDQTLRWMGHFGHLQLETSFVRSEIIDVIGDWIIDHGTQAKAETEELERNIADTGGTLVR